MTKEEAIAKYNTQWWETASPEEIAVFQLNEEKLCCPFKVFHKAVEAWLGRPVWTHEFADTQSLLDEKAGKVRVNGIDAVIGKLRKIAPNKPIIFINPS